LRDVVLSLRPLAAKLRRGVGQGENRGGVWGALQESVCERRRELHPSLAVPADELPEALERDLHFVAAADVLADAGPHVLKHLRGNFFG
jgi:hypothetical protein